MALRSMIYILPVVVLFATTTTDAQVRRLSRQAIDSIRNISPFDVRGRVLQFERTSHDMGAMYETDSLYQMSFVFSNVSGKDVSITKITTSCGCVVADYPKNAIAPGENAEIDVMFNPKGMSGTVNTDVFVYTTLSDTKPTSRLCITGNIIALDEWDFLPHKIGTLRLKRKEVVFDIVNTGQKPSMCIVCANAGTTPLNLSASLLPPYATFATEPSVLEPGCEGDLVITIDGEKIPRNATEDLRSRIVIDGVVGSPLERTLKILIKQIKK